MVEKKLEKEQVIKNISQLIYYGKLNDAWELALANPIVHPGKQKPIVGVKSQSGRWIVVLPIVNKANSTMEQRQEYYNQFDKTMVSPQLEGNRFIFLT
jgi:hypothetical protein